MKDRGLSADSTIYNYTLIHKKVLPRLFPPVYAMTFTVLFGLLVYLYPAHIVSIAAAVPIMLILHFTVTKVFLKLTLDPSLPLWRMRWFYPWIGWLPVQHVALRSFARLNQHLLIIGFVFVGLLYYTVHSAGLWMLAITHVSLLFPRFWIIWSAPKRTQMMLLKLDQGGVSFYQS